MSDGEETLRIELKPEHYNALQKFLGGCCEEVATGESGKRYSAAD